jgi:hypothetical protein
MFNQGFEKASDSAALMKTVSNFHILEYRKVVVAFITSRVAYYMSGRRGPSINLLESQAAQAEFIYHD